MIDLKTDVFFTRAKMKKKWKIISVAVRLILCALFLFLYSRHVHKNAHKLLLKYHLKYKKYSRNSDIVKYLQF